MKKFAKWITVWLLFTCADYETEIIVWHVHHGKKKWRIEDMWIPRPMTHLCDKWIYFDFKTYCSIVNVTTTIGRGHHCTNITSRVECPGLDLVRQLVIVHYVLYQVTNGTHKFHHKKVMGMNMPYRIWLWLWYIHVLVFIYVLHQLDFLPYLSVKNLSCVMNCEILNLFLFFILFL